MNTRRNVFHAGMRRRTGRAGSGRRSWCAALIGFGATLAVTQAFAAPQFAALFTDHAVLQRGVVVPVWGTAAPGEHVQVSYRGVKVDAVTNAAGEWTVRLPVMDVGEASDLTVIGETTVSATDVEVGDVWLLSGQSNMAFPLAKDNGGRAALAGASLPWLRELKVPYRVSDQEQRDLKAAWVPANGRTLGTFSAVGYYFARNLYRDGSVPVGLLNVSHGGTTIEAWMGSEALKNARNGAAVMRRWADIVARYPEAKAQFDRAMTAWTEAKQKAEAAGEKFTARPSSRPVGPGSVMQPSGLFNGMLSSVMPAAVRGVIWYQGESNVVRPVEYGDLLSAMMREWRARFRNPALPFYVVQLPNYADAKFSWAALRQEQAVATAADPQAHLIVTIDLGDSKDKHPRSKAELGRRLSMSVRQHSFDDVRPGDAPTVKQAWRDGETVTLAFENGGERLTLKPVAAGRPSFEVAGTGGTFFPAQVKLWDGLVTVRSASVPEPVHVRYLADNDPAPCLFTDAGLCVGPFALSGLRTKN